MLQAAKLFGVMKMEKMDALCRILLQFREARRPVLAGKKRKYR